MSLKERLLQQTKESKLLQNYYQSQLDELYMYVWNTSVIPTEFPSNKHNHRFTWKQLQKKLKKNKNWILSYLDFYKWDNDILAQNRVCDIIAAYLAYDSSLHVLQKLHFTKYYCEHSKDYYTLTNEKALIEIAKQSYLQNSLYESGKSSYVKK